MVEQEVQQDPTLEKRMKLYGELGKEYDLPPFEQWVQTLQDPTKLQQAYGSISKGYDVDYVTFASSLGINPQPIKVTHPTEIGGSTQPFGEPFDPDKLLGRTTNAVAGPPTPPEEQPYQPQEGDLEKKASFEDKAKLTSTWPGKPFIAEVDKTVFSRALPNAITKMSYQKINGDYVITRQRFSQSGLEETTTENAKNSLDVTVKATALMIQDQENKRPMRSQGDYIRTAHNQLEEEFGGHNGAISMMSALYRSVDAITLGAYGKFLHAISPNPEQDKILALSRSQAIRDEVTPFYHDSIDNQLRRIIWGAGEGYLSAQSFMTMGGLVSGLGVGEAGASLLSKSPFWERITAKGLQPIGKIVEGEAPKIIAGAIDGAITFGGVDLYSQVVNDGRVDPIKFAESLIVGGFFPSFTRNFGKVWDSPTRVEAFKNATKGLIGAGLVNQPSMIIDYARQIQKEDGSDFFTALGTAAHHFGEDPIPLVANALTMMFLTASGMLDKFSQRKRTREAYDEVSKKPVTPESQKMADKLREEWKKYTEGKKPSSPEEPPSGVTPIPIAPKPLEPIESGAKIPTKEGEPPEKIGIGSDFKYVKVGDKIRNENAILDVVGRDDKTVWAKLSNGKIIKWNRESYDRIGFKVVGENQLPTKPSEPPKITLPSLAMTEPQKPQGEASKAQETLSTQKVLSPEPLQASGFTPDLSLPNTPEFRNWRKGKKVLVLYHGTEATIEGFEGERSGLGTHLGTPEQANDAANRKTGGEFAGQQIYKVYAKVGKSLKTEDVINWNNPFMVAKELIKRLPEQADKIKDTQDDYVDNKIKEAEFFQVMRDVIKKAGYDSIVYHNFEEGSTQYFNRIEELTQKYGDESKIPSKEYPTNLSYVIIDDANIKSTVNSGKFTLTRNLLDTLNEAKKGLDELTKSGRLQGGLPFPTFDEESYARAKPYFQKSWESFKAAGRNIIEWFDEALAKFGEGWRPFIERFVKEEKLALEEKTVGTPPKTQQKPQVGTDEYRDFLNKLSPDEQRVEIERRNKERIDEANKLPDIILPPETSKEQKPIEPPKIVLPKFVDVTATPDPTPGTTPEVKVGQLQSSNELMEDIKKAYQSMLPAKETGINVTEGNVPEGKVAQRKKIEEGTLIPKLSGTLEHEIKGLKKQLAEESKVGNQKKVDFLNKQLSQAEDALAKERELENPPSPGIEVLKDFIPQMDKFIDDFFGKIPRSHLSPKSIKAFMLQEAGLSTGDRAELLGTNYRNADKIIKDMWNFINTPNDLLKMNEIATKAKIVDFIRLRHPEFEDFVREAKNVDLTDEDYLRRLFDVSAAGDRLGNADEVIRSNPASKAIQAGAINGVTDQDLNLHGSVNKYTSESMGAATKSDLAFGTPEDRLKQFFEDAGQLSEVPSETKLKKWLDTQIGDQKSNIGQLQNFVKNVVAYGKKAYADWKNLPKFTEYKEVFGRYLADKNKADQKVDELRGAIVKSFPDDISQEAVTAYIRAGGDTAELQRRLDWLKDPDNVIPRIQQNPAMKSVYEKAIQYYEKAQQLTPEQKEAAAEISAYFSEKLHDGINMDILSQGVDDFVTQLWKRPNVITQRLAADFTSSKFNTNFYAARKRIFDSDFEGLQLGYEPLTQKIGDLVAIYENAFGRAVMSRAFVKELTKAKAADGRPLLATSGFGTPIERDIIETGVGPAVTNIGPDTDARLISPHGKPHELFDYRPIEHPLFRKWKWIGKELGGDIFLQGDLIAHPDIHDNLNNAFATSGLLKWAPVRWITDFQSFAKGSKFSLSAFHYVQEATHAAGHTVNPLTDLPTIDLNDELTYALVSHGLMLRDKGGLADMYEGLTGSKALFRIPLAGRSVIQPMTHHLFEEWIPKLKLKTAQHILARNMERYRSELDSGKINFDQVMELSANQANAAYGMLNYKWMGRNPTLQHAFRLLIMAPDFLEARLKFAGQAISPYGREQARAIGILGAELYLVTRIMNAIFNDGDFDLVPDATQPFSIRVGNRRFGIRSVPSDIYHLVTGFTDFWKNRLAPFVSYGIEVAEKRDWRGVRVDTKQEIKDLGRLFYPIPATPREDITVYEGLLNALALQPNRFSYLSEIKKNANAFRTKMGKSDVAGAFPTSKYASLERALSDNDIDGAVRSYEQLLENDTPDAIQLGFKQSTTRPFTGSKQLDDLFFQSLSKKEKEVWHKAQQERNEMITNFNKAIARYHSLGKKPDLTPTQRLQIQLKHK